MIKIPYTYRRAGGRYQFRRKLYLPKIGLLHISSSLRTGDRGVARVRAAAVTAALDWAVHAMGYKPFSLGVRSASEAKNLLKAVTDLTIGIATQGYFDPSVPADLVIASCLVNADFHDLAARHGGRAVLDDVDEQRLRSEGRDDLHIARLRKLIAAEGDGLVISDISLRSRLEHLGIPPLPGSMVQDRLLMHRGISEGQRRAMFFNDPRVVASGDQLGYLVDTGGILTASFSPPSDQPTEPAAVANDAAPDRCDTPVARVSPLLSELIAETVQAIVQKGAWSEGVGLDALRLMKQFVWTVGDKPCDAYNQTDVARFRRELWDMPKTVRVQSIWHLPFEQAKQRWPEVIPSSRRSNKTLNKDLSYMATFASEMVATGYWRRGQIDPLALAAKITRTEKHSGRKPWTPTHLKSMFQSPIYSGNLGSKRRLKPGTMVFHDAAYWMPLLGAYQIGRRDEHAGHLLSDFVFNIGTPHMLIEPNAMRELKNEESKRFIAIHPRLLELGLREYVEAARARGEKALFPELWINAAKKGGDQYYAVSWRKLVDSLRQQPGVVIPATPDGKEADFHSIRSTGLSQLDRSDINQNIVKDIAGHAREGTTALSYQKLLESGGLEDVLQEQLKVLLRLPDYAGEVKCYPVTVLPMGLRSR